MVTHQWSNLFQVFLIKLIWRYLAGLQDLWLFYNMLANCLDEIINLKDPVGIVLSEWNRPNGLNIKKVSVPLGVIGIIYESRPNVTVDASAIAIKAGNSVILRGGKDSFHSSQKLNEIIN